MQQTTRRLNAGVLKCSRFIKLCPSYTYLACIIVPRVPVCVATSMTQSA